MTELEGNLRKMRTEHSDPVHYEMPLGDAALDVNELLGRSIRMSFAGRINCIKCGRLTKTSFGQGFCYNCFRTAPEASECIIRPELCRAHEGVARDMEWAERHCLQPHIVYLAKSSAIKVGITREEQIPTRWMDQGASEAVIFARVPNRYTAGLLEVSMKEHLTDRTNWRKMLRNEITEEDLLARRDELLEIVDPEFSGFLQQDATAESIHYPVNAFPVKVKSVGFDKLPLIEGELRGIKGQYLLLDGDRVLNIRKHQGYYVEFNAPA